MNESNVVDQFEYVTKRDTALFKHFRSIYYSFIGKHDVGIERALGTLFFVEGGFDSQDAFELYNRKVNKFKSFYYTAQMFSDNVNNMYKEGYANAGFNVTTHVNHLRYIVQNTEQIRASNITMARMWFDNMTVYMDSLFSIQSDLGNFVVALCTFVP